MSRELATDGDLGGQPDSPAEANAVAIGLVEGLPRVRRKEPPAELCTPPVISVEATAAREATLPSKVGVGVEAPFLPNDLM